MGLISIRSAAKTLNRDERTIRRWTESGILAASQAVNGQTMVDSDEVVRLAERLAQEEDTRRRRRTQPDTEQLLSVIEDLRSQVEGLQERVSSLENIRAGPVRMPSAVRHESSSDVPPGLEVATVFIGGHFPDLDGEKIARMAQTLRENGSVPMITGRWKMGRATAHYALDQAGRRAFYLAASRREGFHRCGECPHEEDE